MSNTRGESEFKHNFRFNNLIKETENIDLNKNSELNSGNVSPSKFVLIYLFHFKNF